MKTWAKIGIGCLVVLVAACVISAVVLVVAGKGIKGWFNKWSGGAADMAKNVQAIQKLDKEYAFTPPADGDVDEARLQAYIGVCSDVKAAMAPYAGWIKAHQGKQKGDWGDVKKAMSMTNDLTAAMLKGYEQYHMGPQEFHWIESAMRQAGREQGSGKMPEAQQQMIQSSIQVLEEQMNAPGTSEADKAKLQEQVDKLKSQLSEVGGTEVSHNRALYEKYEAQLKENDLEQFGDVNIKTD
jgi:ribosomal protein L24